MEQNIKTTMRPSQPVGADTNNASKGYELLLKVEAEARQAQTSGELAFLIANETIRIAKCRQIFVLAGRAENLVVKAVTSVGSVDRNAPRIRWVEAMVRLLRADKGLAAPCDFALPAYSPPGDEEDKNYPYRFVAWLPLKLRDNSVFGGLLLTRETPWTEADLLIARRLTATYSHAWAALVGERRLKRRIKVKPLLAVSALMAVALGFYPVPLTVLAPVEVAPIGARIIAAPMDGVIDNIIVNPDQACPTSCCATSLPSPSRTCAWPKPS